MYDISIYGHLTIDRIFDKFKESRTLGAIGNFWEACMLTDPSLFLDIQPTAIGEAIIFVNKEKCTRQGRGILNLYNREQVEISKSRWNHVMYLNKIEDPSFLDSLTDSILSADITSGDMKNIEYFKHLDYLFISDEDIFMDIEELANMVKGWVILHFPNGSICHNGKEMFKTSVKFIENLNVLGAGDFFAASFITRMLKGGEDVKKCVEFAHNNTSKLLLRSLNEKN